MLHARKRAKRCNVCMTADEYCADFGKKLWYRTNTRNKDIHFFVCSNSTVDYRGTCSDRHYIRADALEEVKNIEWS